LGHSTDTYSRWYPRIHTPKTAIHDLGVPSHILSKQVLHPYIFNVNIRFRVQYIHGLQTNTGFDYCGVCMVDPTSSWPKRDIQLIFLHLRGFVSLV
jgi:hypothetical protein